MRTKRLRGNITKFLTEYGNSTTNEIIHYINRKTRDGTTSQQIGNVLSSHPLVEKKGKSAGGKYSVCIWGLKSSDST